MSGDPVDRADDDRTVSVVDGAGTVVEAVVSTWRTPAGSYGLRLTGPWGRTEVTADDLFEALTEVRRGLEPHWRVLVQGARRDTYPSGMQRDQAAGRRVYQLRAGRPTTRDDVLDTFAPADAAAVGTVAEQRRTWEQWLPQAPGGGRR